MKAKRQAKASKTARQAPPAKGASVAPLLRGLAKLYPNAHCALHFNNPLQLLVATILSAQCTDVRVNMVTPALFARYTDAQAFADADPHELERMIQSTGFFRNKAKNIIACCRILVERHEGRVPGTLEELVPLPGEVDPVRVERDLMEQIPRKDWTMFSHRMIFHGRQVCFARKPNCAGCTLAKICPKIGVPSLPSPSER
jgi:endonuclease-3